MSEEEKEENIDSNEIFGEQEYKIGRIIGNTELNGVEMQIVDEHGDVYAGKGARDIIEQGYVRENPGLWMGYSEDPIEGSKSVYVPPEQLLRHMAIFGRTGVGKSTLLRNMMIQLAFQGHGFTFIDPTRQDIKKLVELLPEHRLDDIVWVDPEEPMNDKCVGFNLFDIGAEKGTIDFENEVQAVVSDFISILKQSISDTDSWGPNMSDAAEEITNALMRLDNDYTLLDLETILSNQEEREALAEQEGLDEMSRNHLRRLAEMESKKFHALQRRIRKWTRNAHNRTIIAHEGSKISISEAIENNKILLIRGPTDDDLARLLFTVIVRRIWSSIRSRDEANEDLDPYYLLIDEFDVLAGKAYSSSSIDKDMNLMFSKARKYALGIIVSTQQPEQLTEIARQGIRGNVKNKFTFNPGDRKSSFIAQNLDLSEQELKRLPKHTIAGRIIMEDKDMVGDIVANTYPPYPPRRTEKEAEYVIRNSVEKYGSERTSQGNLAYGIIGRRKRGSLGQEDEEIIKREILISLLKMKIREEGEEINNETGWFTISEIKDELRNSMDISSINIVNVLEKIPDTKMQKVRYDEKVYYKLTPRGEEVRVQDTGSSDSGGGEKHRELLAKAWTELTKLGYDVELPTQDKVGMEFDGVAEPNISPVKDAETREEMEELEEKVKEKYPRQWDLFKDNDLAIEAEESGRKKRTQPIINLSKAVEDKKHALFVVYESNPKEDKDPEHWARRLSNVFEDPPFAKRETNEGIQLYSSGENIETSSGSVPVLKLEEKKQGTTKWFRRDNSLLLKHPETDKTKTVIENYADIDKPKDKKFPYVSSLDAQRGKHVLYKIRPDGTKEEQDTYESIREMVKDGYMTVKRPIVPELMFNDKIPSEDEWSILIIPYDEGSEIEEPMLYEKGELELLHKNIEISDEEEDDYDEMDLFDEDFQ